MLAHRADIRGISKLDEEGKHQAETIQDMARRVMKDNDITNLETGNTRRCEKTHRVFKVFTANAIAKQKVDWRRGI